MYIKLILLLYITYSNADIKFPPNAPADVEVYNRNLQEQSSQYQLKNTYDQFIDDIITKGVTDLGFSLHRSAKKYENADYLVYSPVSIASESESYPLKAILYTEKLLQLHFICYCWVQMVKPSLN